jgi:DNA mismatch endonuclease (patch repair protein)
VDKITPQSRSENMRQIRSKNTLPEIVVRRIVYGLGYRYRLHAKDLPGKPDLVLRPRKKAIFVHGCFWHQHSACREGRIPDTKPAYWKPKLIRNVKRDNEHLAALSLAGWQTLVVWECELRDEKKLAVRLESFLAR